MANDVIQVDGGFLFALSTTQEDNTSQMLRNATAEEEIYLGNALVG